MVVETMVVDTIVVETTVILTIVTWTATTVYMSQDRFCFILAILRIA